jgi:hypothetical protein
MEEMVETSNPYRMSRCSKGKIANSLSSATVRSTRNRLTTGSRRGYAESTAQGMVTLMAVCNILLRAGKVYHCTSQGGCDLCWTKRLGIGMLKAVHVFFLSSRKPVPAKAPQLG